jgi:hypothetical protein
MKKITKRILYLIAALGVLYLLLLIPDSKEKNITVETGKKPFAWKSDSLWLQMEELFKQARQMDTAKLDSLVNFYRVIAETEFNQLQIKICRRRIPPG